MYRYDFVRRSNTIKQASENIRSGYHSTHVVPKKDNVFLNGLVVVLHLALFHSRYHDIQRGF